MHIPALSCFRIVDLFYFGCILLEKWFKRKPLERGEKMMKELTSYTYSFEELIQGEFLYVDKTEYIWNMIRPRTAGYFLSRPRRFGKSLTVSTLKAIFQGKKELFNGLAISKKDYDWKPYPVIHLDMNGLDFSSVEELESSLCGLLKEAAVLYGLALESANAANMFRALINQLAEKEQVVILVDEYDKPILNNLGKAHARAILDKLKTFYSVIKAFESKARFVFVTGVSKFCHVSLFSDLNNLTDISMDYDYATMFGYTQEEFETYFADRIESACRQLKQSKKQLLPEIKRWYDGYRFHAEAEAVYNPVSLAQFFSKRYEFNNYWFSTGTPSFLMELVKKTCFDFESVLSRPVSAVAFEAFEIDKIDPLSLLLQTGYLTIKSLERKFNMPWYWLDFPNQEVSVSFNTYLLNAYVEKSRSDITNFCELLADSMVNGDVDRLRKVLETFFAGISYDVHHKDESNFQNIFFAIFRLLGYYIKAESRTCDGRIDAVTETGAWIYLFEFKLDRDKSALEQIKTKEYFKPYLLSSKRIMLIGVNFDTESGKLSDWQTEEITK